MKKNELKKLALLGVAAGILVSSHSGAEAIERDGNSINLDHVIAKPQCKAHGGCGGLTANRDVNSAKYEEEEIIDTNDLPDGTYEDGKATKEV